MTRHFHIIEKAKLVLDLIVKITLKKSNNNKKTQNLASINRMFSQNQVLSQFQKNLMTTTSLNASHTSVLHIIVKT